jgi:hypothetical protein
MTISAILIAAIYLISLVLTMVGLSGGLIFSPLFVLLGYPKAVAASTSLFLNLGAAASASYAYSRKKMVDFTLAVPLIVSSSLAAPAGAMVNRRLDLEPFLYAMAIVLALVGVCMLMSTPDEVACVDMMPSRKIAGSIGLGTCIGFLGGILGIGGGVFVVPLLIYILKSPHQDRRRLIDLYRLFFIPDRFSGVRLHGNDQLEIHPSRCRGVTCRWSSRDPHHESRMKGKTIRMIFSFILFALCIKLFHQAWLTQ